MTRFILIAMLLLCSACIQLGGQPAPLRYYLLEPVAASHAEHSSGQATVSFSPPAIAGYLDRPQLVSSSQDNQLKIATLDRWSEPLSDNLLRVLQENLRRQLPGTYITPLPHDKSNYRIEILLNRFDGVLGQRLNVDIRWTILAGEDDRILLSDNYRDDRPIGDSYPQMIVGLNGALSNLAAQLATAIQQQMNAN